METFWLLAAAVDSGCCKPRSLMNGMSLELFEIGDMIERRESMEDKQNPFSVKEKSYLQKDYFF